MERLLANIADIKVVQAQISTIEETINKQSTLLSDTTEKLSQVVDNMTLSTRQQQQIYTAAKDRINHLLGGAHSQRYKDYSKSYFINLWNSMKCKFSCGASYKDLNPIYFDKALTFINVWRYESN